MNKQIPQGYKQTKVGIIPEDWEVVKLGDVANIYDGTHMTPTYTTKGIPFYSVETITNDEWNKTKFISEDIFKHESKRVKIEYGDILMTRIGDIGTSKFINWNVKASFYVSLALLKSKGQMSFKYLNHYIGYSSFQNELHKRIIHVAFPKKINLGEISHCNIIKLPLKEQEKIAEILSTWDDVITKQQQLIAQKQQLKKGLMQQIFSQKLRFTDDHYNDYPEWQEKKLGELATITTGGSNREDSTINGGKYTFFDRSQDIRTSNIYLFDCEAVIVAGEGQEFIPKYFIGKFDLHQRTYAIIDFNSAIGIFIYYYLYQNKHYFSSQAVGSTVKSLRLPMFQKCTIYLPNITEQTKIADFLTLVDDEITKLTKTLQQLKLQKKSLMQKLLTGSIRVKL